MSAFCFVNLAVDCPLLGQGRVSTVPNLAKGKGGGELGLQVCVNYKSQIVLSMSYLIRYNPLRTFLKMVIIKIIIHIAVSNNNKK